MPADTPSLLKAKLIAQATQLTANESSDVPAHSYINIAARHGISTGTIYDTLRDALTESDPAHR
jgi:hypothetical protein